MNKKGVFIGGILGLFWAEKDEDSSGKRVGPEFRNSILHFKLGEKLMLVQNPTDCPTN